MHLTRARVSEIRAAERETAVPECEPSMHLLFSVSLDERVDSKAPDADLWLNHTPYLEEILGTYFLAAQGILP